MMTTQPFGEPTITIDQVQRSVRSEVSKKRRALWVGLLLLDAGVLVLLTSLWATEPALPLRTHLAFGAMVAVATAWLTFFAWVLLRRRPLYALDRVMAGRIALAATSLFLAGGIAVAAQRGSWTGLVSVALTGGVFVAIAVTTLTRANRARRALLKRREELQLQLRPAARRVFKPAKPCAIDALSGFTRWL